MLDTWNDYRTRFNRKSWTELYFQVAGYDYRGEPYIAEVSPAAHARVERAYRRIDDRVTVCLNLGGSFPQKVWPDRLWPALAARVLRQGRRVVLRGGPAEEERCRAVQAGFAAEDVCYEPLTLEETCAVPRFCDAMVTNDSFGYHVGLLGGLPCVVLFG